MQSIKRSLAAVVRFSLRLVLFFVFYLFLFGVGLILAIYINTEAVRAMSPQEQNLYLGAPAFFVALYLVSLTFRKLPIALSVNRLFGLDKKPGD